MNTTATAKVDIAKLQILNDRICQTLDALNQVRLSAQQMAYNNPQFGGYTPYGYSPFHTPYQTGNMPVPYAGAYPAVAPTFGWPSQSGFGPFPFNTQFGYGTGNFSPYVQHPHMGFNVMPVGFNGFAGGMTSGMNGGMNPGIFGGHTPVMNTGITDGQWNRTHAFPPAI